MDNKVKIKTDNYTFIFSEDEDAYFQMLKDFDDFRTIIKVIVTDNNNKYMATYMKQFGAKVNDGIIHNFINHFMEFENDRHNYLLDGINITEKYQNKDIVNKKCRDMINRLQKKKMSQLRFKDFMNLKTFGRDSVSSMKESDLIALINPNDIKIIQDENLPKEFQLMAYRWIVRGLQVNYAIRKVKTDMEVRENCGYL